MNQIGQFTTGISSRTGEDISIDKLIREYYSYIFRLAVSILDDPEDAQDATQETFILINTHLGEFRGEAVLKTWITAIAVNVCRGELRKRRGRSLLDKAILGMQTLIGKTPDPEEQAAQNDLHAQLRKAIAGLDEKYRLPVILHYVQHLSASQIAAVLKTNENTIHARLFHARRKLAKQLRCIEVRK
jgi:RNA polymerase sigma-70 factor (ECF subfamily)